MCAPVCTRRSRHTHRRAYSDSANMGSLLKRRFIYDLGTGGGSQTGESNQATHHELISVVDVGCSRFVKVLLFAMSGGGGHSAAATAVEPPGGVRQPGVVAGGLLLNWHLQPGRQRPGAQQPEWRLQIGRQHAYQERTLSKEDAASEGLSGGSKWGGNMLNKKMLRVKASAADPTKGATCSAKTMLRVKTTVAAANRVAADYIVASMCSRVAASKA